MKVLVFRAGGFPCNHLAEEFMRAGTYVGGCADMIGRDVELIGYREANVEETRTFLVEIARYGARRFIHSDR